MITDTQAGTNIQEIAEGIFRINTPVPLPDGGEFSFNQFLILDEEPLLFHTGPRQLFPLVRQAVGHVMDPSNLRYVGLSHFEADECGSLNDWLQIAPRSVAVCSRLAAMLSVDDVALRPAHALSDGGTLGLGRRTVKWIDTPHVPHGWEAGLLLEQSTSTLFCGDLLSQPGGGRRALTDGDILGPSEAFRSAMDYYAHAPATTALLERLASEAPATLACMHGSAWSGDGGALLRQLSGCLSASRAGR